MNGFQLLPSSSETKKPNSVPAYSRFGFLGSCLTVLTLPTRGRLPVMVVHVGRKSRVTKT